MRCFWKNYLQNNLFFWIFAGIAMVMLVVSWIMPPAWAIDKSVLTSVGEIMGFVAIGTVIKAIDKGLETKLKHNNTEISISGNDEDKK